MDAAPDGPANQRVRLIESSTILAYIYELSNDHWGELAIDLTLDLSVHLFCHRSFMQGKPFAPEHEFQHLKNFKECQWPVGAWSITVRISPRLRCTSAEIKRQTPKQVKLHQEAADISSDCSVQGSKYSDNVPEHSLRL